MLKVDELGFIPKKQMIKYQSKITHAIFETYKGDEAEEVYEAMLEMAEAWGVSRFYSRKRQSEKEENK